MCVCHPPPRRRALANGGHGGMKRLPGFAKGHHAKWLECLHYVSVCLRFGGPGGGGTCVQVPGIEGMEFGKRHWRTRCYLVIICSTTAAFQPLPVYTYFSIRNDLSKHGSRAMNPLPVI